MKNKFLFTAIALHIVSNSATAASLINSSPSKLSSTTQTTESADAVKAQTDQLTSAQTRVEDLTAEVASANVLQKDLGKRIDASSKRILKLAETVPIGSTSPDLEEAKAQKDALEKEYNQLSKKIMDLSNSLIDAKKNLSDIQLEQRVQLVECNPMRGGKIFCRIDRTETEYFSDFSMSPTLADGAELKLGLIRGRVELGEKFSIPLTILMADVTSQTAPDEANTTKLLDPDQGINMGTEFAWKYRIGPVCAGETTAKCVLGFNLGGRYLKLQENDSEQSKSTYGAFATLQTAWSFNVFEEGNQDNKLGTIRLNAAYSHFYHDGKNSDDYFAGITDGKGAPVQFEQDFGSLKYGLSIYLQDSINLSYSKFKAYGDAGIKDDESISLNFDALKF